MPEGSIVQLIILVCLLVLSAFFSSAETALTTVNKIRIRALADDGNKRAKVVLQLIEHPDKMLSAILIGNNIVNLSASSLATTVATKLLGSVGAGIATGILTFVVLVLGEITPKSLATLHNEKLSLSYAKAIRLLMFLMTPFIFIVNKISFFLLKLLHIDTNGADQSITENELRTIVEVGKNEGVIEYEEHIMINNVFDFGDSMAKDIMIPRIDMVFAHVDATFEELLEIYMEEQYTRLPVYEESKDHVIGILNIKDLFFYHEKHKNEEFHIRDILREPYFTYEFQKTSDLLSQLKQSRINFAVVLDEYGATAGLVTLEDLLEEIVGEIRDEYDENEEDTIRTLGENEYDVDAAIKIDDLNDAIGTHITSEDYDSLGGHIIELLDHLPSENETATEDNIEYKVLTIEKNRIERVYIKILPIEEAEEEQDD